jgi:hypothetical protein
MIYGAEIRPLLEYSAAYSGNSTPVFWENSPIFKVQDGTESLSQNTDKELPLFIY